MVISSVKMFARLQDYYYYDPALEITPNPILICIMLEN